MVEVGKAAEERTEPIVKQQNDRSFHSGEKEESGVESMPSGDSNVSNEISDGSAQTSSGYDSSEKESKSSWEDYEGEIINLSTFQLDAFHSSNVVERVQECDISTIEHDGTPRLRKGFYFFTLINDVETLNHFRWEVQLYNN